MDMRLIIALVMLCPVLLSAQLVSRTELRATNDSIRAETVERTDGIATNLTSIGTLYSGPDALNWWGTINGAVLLSRRTNGQGSFRMIADAHSSSSTNAFLAIDLDPGGLAELEFKSAQGGSVNGTFLVQVNPGEARHYLKINTLVYADIFPSVADGASAVAYQLATLNTLADPAARLLSVQNPLGTEKFGVAPDGTLTMGGGNSGGSLSLYSSNLSGNSFTLKSGLVASNMTLLVPSNTTVGLTRPVLVVSNLVYGANGASTGQLAWVDSSTFGGATSTNYWSAFAGGAGNATISSGAIRFWPAGTVASVSSLSGGARLGYLVPPGRTIRKFYFGPYLGANGLALGTGTNLIAHLWTNEVAYGPIATNTATGSFVMASNEAVNLTLSQPTRLHIAISNTTAGNVDAYISWSMQGD